MAETTEIQPSNNHKLNIHGTLSISQTSDGLTVIFSPHGKLDEATSFGPDLGLTLNIISNVGRIIILRVHQRACFGILGGMNQGRPGVRVIGGVIGERAGLGTPWG